jgi:hypothetical protein
MFFLKLGDKTLKISENSLDILNEIKKIVEPFEYDLLLINIKYLYGFLNKYPEKSTNCTTDGVSMYLEQPGTISYSFKAKEHLYLFEKKL